MTPGRAYRRWLWLAPVGIALWLALPLCAQQHGGAAARRHFPDNPRARQAWFARGRQAPAGESPARLFLRARRQLRRMPVVRPRVVMHAAARAASTGPANASLSGAGPAGPSTAGPSAGSAAPYAAATALAAPASFGGTWTSLGPQPETAAPWGDVAGRVTALALDPADTTGNTLYVGAAYGGLWKSTNAMSAQPTFTPIGDNMPTLAVGSIAIDDSTTPPTLYVGTGEPNNSLDSYYGVGILKSADGGQTWTEATDADNGAETFLGLAFGAILIAPSQPQTLLACASNANDTQDGGTEVPGVYQSSDGGQTWSLVLSQPDNVPGYATADSGCTSLVYDASRGEYIAALRGRGYYASSTGAAGSWTALASPFPSGTAATVENFYRASLAVRGADWFAIIADYKDDPSAPGSTDTGLAVSVNGGQSWQPIAVPPSVFCAAQGSVPCQGAYDQYVAAPPGETSLVVGGIDVWSAPTVSTQSMAWTNLTNSYTTGSVHPDQHAIAFLDGTHWFIGNDGGVWSTANAGGAWTDMNATLNTIQFMSVSAIGGGVYLGGSQDNGTALSAASGTAWKLVWGGDGGDTAVLPATPQELLTENADVSLEYSLDGGGTFNPVVTSKTITDPSSFYVPYELDPSDPTQVLLGTDRVWEGPADTSPPGTGWAPLGPQDSTSNYCGPVTNTVTAVAAAPSSADVIYEGFADGTLMMTANATAAQPTWTQLYLPAATGCNPPTPVAALAVNPTDPKTVYVGLQGLGTGTHIYKSTDGGSTFTDITGNLPDVPINSIVIDPNTPTNIYVADDVGVFVASDGGQANEVWSRLGTGLPAAAVLQIALTGGSAPSIVAATHGRGAWVIPAQAPPTFLISLAPATQTLTTSSAATYTVASTAENGYAGTLSLSCTAPAAGCTFSPATIAAGSSSTLTVDASELPGGTSAVTVQATDGAVTRTASAQLVANNFEIGFDQSNPIDVHANGQQVFGSVGIITWSGYTGNLTFSCPSPPPGISCAFSPTSEDFVNPVAQTGGFAVGVSASAAAAAGPSSLAVAASDGAITHTTTVPVVVEEFSVAIPNPIYALAGVNTATAAVTVSTLSGFAGSVALSCQAEPPLSCSLSPTSAAPGTPVTLTLTGMNQLGDNLSSSVTVTGTSGGMSQSAMANAEVSDFSLNPQFNGPQAVLPGVSSLQLEFFTGWSGVFTAPVSLSCSGLAPPASCAFSSSTVALGQSFTLTINGLGSLAAGTMDSFNLVASGGGIQHQLAMSVGVSDFAIAPQFQGVPPAVGQVGAAPATIQIQPTVGGASMPGAVFSLTQCSAPAPLTCTLPATTGASTIVQLGGFAQWTGPDDATVALAASVAQSGVTVTHTMNWAVPIEDFSLAATGSTATVKPGGTGVFAMTATSIHGWSDPVQLSCSGLPSGAVCAFYANGAALSGQQDLNFAGPSVPFTADVFTTSSSTVPPPPGQPWPWLLAAFLLAAAAATLATRRAHRRLRWAAACLGALAISASLAACGGGGGGGAGGGGGTSQAKTYQIKVTAASTNVPQGAAPVTRSAEVTLTVQ